MSLKAMLKHEASLEASTCVSPFKCLEGSNHLAFGNTLSLDLPQTKAEHLRTVYFFFHHPHNMQNPRM